MQKRNIPCLLLMFLTMNLPTMAQDMTSYSNDIDKYGTWVKLGEPVNEFPICYQLWRCDKSHLNEDNQTVQKDKLPIGEWGLCDNYLSPNPDNPTYCAQCDVPSPETACY